MSDREAFEKWCETQESTYHKSGMWKAWQAAQAQAGDEASTCRCVICNVSGTDGLCDAHKYDEQLVQAAQAQAGKPVAAVHGWFHGECVIRALDPEAVLPAGMALYSQPQAQAGDDWVIEVEAGQVVMSRIGSNFTGYLYTAPPAAVNQQLLEALLEHFVAARFAIDAGMNGTAMNCINEGIAAIAAAQEQSK